MSHQSQNKNLNLSLYIIKVIKQKESSEEINGRPLNRAEKGLNPKSSELKLSSLTLPPNPVRSREHEWRRKCRSSPSPGQRSDLFCVFILFSDIVIASAYFSPFFKSLSKRGYKRKKPFQHLMTVFGRHYYLFHRTIARNK